MAAIILQIVGFPGLFLVTSIIISQMTRNQDNRLNEYARASVYAITSYMLVTLFTFPLWFIFKPEEVGGIYFLSGLNVYAFWIVCIFVVTPLVLGLLAHPMFLKRVEPGDYVRKGVLMGCVMLVWSLFLEIVIYVYLRKTIPSIPYYFFGKNFPWIDINWVVGFLTPIVTGYILRRRSVKKVS